MQAGVAAGHPATTAAGMEILTEGGSAADAAVAACLASCVAETVMTGLLGGGHAIHFDAASGRARNLDCFVAVPGLGGEPREPGLIHLQVPFGAMLAPVMTMNEGAAIYAPGGNLLGPGELLRQPGLVAALAALADDRGSVYRGSIADALLDLCAERDGLVTRADLQAYEPEWSEPVSVDYLEGRLLTRAGLSGMPETVPRLPRLAGTGATERVLALVDVLEAPSSGDGDTTNVSVVDADGNACVLTTSLGLGSGDFLPGLDLHLNSMLGEDALLRGGLEPGGRMQSMMSPTLCGAVAIQPT